MIKRIADLWENNPLKLILWLAVILRLVSAIFSKGFGMHDDHFLVIEAAQSWVDGHDYNNWLPGSQTNAVPTGHSFFYVGIHYLILWFLKFMHVYDPQVKMFIIRLLHAGFSLVTVYYGYKITLKIANKKAARMTGLLLAVYWFMPFLSVRNLVEMVCIPFLIYGTWLILDHWYDKKAYPWFILAGIIVGLAFSIRFQTITFAFGLGLAILLKLRWKEAFWFGAAFILSCVLVQGSLDMFIWGRPFAEFGEYVRYNMENTTSYFDIPWYNYILLLAGALIPPISIFLLFGFFREWKKHLIIFLPSFVFLVFHSLYPNKQERFIFPIIPFIILLGVVGWYKFLQQTKFEEKHHRLIRGSWIFFWIMNLILLLPVSTMYSKKARVESMTYLAKYKNITSILLEDSNENFTRMVPMFYLGQWIRYYEVTNEKPVSELPDYVFNDVNFEPRFILFYETKNIQQRVDTMKKYFPDIVYETTIYPGLVDKILYWLNPINANQTIVIYRNKDLMN